MGTQDFLICIEMFIVSITHIYVFDYESFRNPEKVPFIKSIFLDGKVKETLLPLLGMIYYIFISDILFINFLFFILYF